MNLRHFFEEKHIKFGTSGIRASNTALTDEVCYTTVLAFLRFLEQEKLSLTGGKLAVAGDLRSTTDKIISAVWQALQASGYSGVYLGKLPTPALSYYCSQQQIAGLMVTGSHIEAGMNGIKFYLARGEILKRDEEAILEQAILPSEKLFTASGILKERTGSPPILNDSAYQQFLQRYLDFFPPNSLRGMRLGLYQHSSVASSLLMKLAKLLGATVLPFGVAEEFQSVDTEALTDYDLRLAREKAAEHKLDAIISTDGDGDRPLLADEKGEWLRGDAIGMLSALILGADYVVLPLTCNSSIERLPFFRRIIRTRVGSPYVIEGINSLLAQNKKNILGYEANGGVLLGTRFKRQGLSLAALPTRDGILPLLCILSHLNKNQLTLSNFARQYQTTFTASSSLKNFPNAELGWFDKGSIKQVKLIETLQQLFRAGTLLRGIDYTDGLRLSFENGELIHLRFSGNAPELRCYTEAGDPKRAQELNQKCTNLISQLRESHHVEAS